jgi:hypothetical protein
MSTAPIAQGPVECRVKLCRDCKYSVPEPHSEWTLRCMHPLVNARDPWALAGSKPHGSCARDEREKTWTLRGLAPCGMRGALWEPNFEMSGLASQKGEDAKRKRFEVWIRRADLE